MNGFHLRQVVSGISALAITDFALHALFALLAFIGLSYFGFVGLGLFGLVILIRRGIRSALI